MNKENLCGYMDGQYCNFNGITGKIIMPSEAEVDDGTWGEFEDNNDGLQYGIYRCLAFERGIKETKGKHGDGTITAVLREQEKCSMFKSQK